jgi:hypothetical protein
MKATVLTTVIVLIFALQNTMAAADSTKMEPQANDYFAACVNLYPDDIIEFRVVKEAEDQIILKIYKDGKIKMYHKNKKKVNSLEVDCDASNLDPGTYVCTVEKNGKEVLRKSIVLN